MKKYRKCPALVKPKLNLFFTKNYYYKTLGFNFQAQLLRIDIFNLPLQLEPLQKAFSLSLEGEHHRRHLQADLDEGALADLPQGLLRPPEVLELQVGGGDLDEGALADLLQGLLRPPEVLEFQLGGGDLDEGAVADLHQGLLLRPYCR